MRIFRASIDDSEDEADEVSPMVEAFGEALGAASASDIVSLQIGNDLPIVVETELVDGSGSLTFVLAPRVEVE